MWVCHVLACQIAFLLGDSLRTVHYFDASPTACCDRLENPERGSVTLALCVERLVIFLHQVAHGADYEVSGELGPHATHVAPQQVFAPQLRRPWEVVRLLVLVQVLDVVCIDVACPLHIEQIRVRLKHREARCLARVNHCVVDVGRV